MTRQHQRGPARSQRAWPLFSPAAVVVASLLAFTTSPSWATWTIDEMALAISQCRQAITAEAHRDYMNQVKAATGRAHLTEGEAARFVRTVEPLLGVCECAMDQIQHEMPVDQLPVAGASRIQALVASGQCTVTVDRSQAAN